MVVPYGEAGTWRLAPGRRALAYRFPCRQCCNSVSGQTRPTTRPFVPMSAFSVKRPQTDGPFSASFGHLLPVGWVLWMARSLGWAVTRCFCIDVSADLVRQLSSAGKAPAERLDEALITLATLGLGGGQGGIR